MSVTTQPIPMRTDNYAWLLTDKASGKVGVVDPADAAPVREMLESQGKTLDFIFLTHHHDDHIGGARELAAAYHALIIGHDTDAARLPKLDIPVHEGSPLTFGAALVRVLATPGHTLGHIAYYIADGGLLFPGDTLFSLGCGRLFEGTPAQLFESLAKFRDLPDETLVCAGHEYSEANARFACSVDPHNQALQARAAEISTLRAQNRATLPVSLGSERATNPFLRAQSIETLAKLRAAKDVF